MTRTITMVIAALAMLLSFAAQAVGISGSLVPGGTNGGALINFTCDGSPTCTGTYTATLHDDTCNATISFSGNFTMTGINPSQPTSTGNITLAGFTAFVSPCPNTAATTIAGTYTVTSDGVNGTISATVSTPGGPKPLQGTFSVGSASPVRVSGVISASDPSGAFIQLSFSCTGVPTCTGTFNFLERDRGCSNSFSFGGTFVLTNFDLSHPGSLSGAVTLYGGSNSNTNPDGTCTYSVKDNAAHSAPYTATWNGTSGTMTVTAQNGDGSTFPVSGTFSAAGIAPPPTFPMTVTASITPTTSNATAQIQPRPQDAGTTQSVFVFAYAPQSLLAGKVLKDGPDPCVLAQIGPNGQLIGTSASNLAPVITTVLSSNGTLINILNNVNTPNISGASVYVGYGTNPNGMFTNGTYQGAVNIPGATQCNTNLATTATPALPGALTGLWWNANESGWGIHFTQRGNNVFAAWYTYDAAGKPKWYVSTCTGFTGNAGTCNGTLFEVTGPNFFGVPFNPSLVNATNAGTLTLTFTNASTASMFYSVAGVTRTVALTRQPLGGGTTTPAVDFSDIWWGGTSESGWGMAMAQQSGITFLAWYVYDANGKPTWLVATCTMSGNTGTGTLYRTTGPAFGPSFDPTRVTATTAGSVSVNFTDANNAVLNYTVDGVSGSKSVTRQLF